MMSAQLKYEGFLTSSRTPIVAKANQSNAELDSLLGSEAWVHAIKTTHGADANGAVRAFEALLTSQHSAITTVLCQSALLESIYRGRHSHRHAQECNEALIRADESLDTNNLQGDAKCIVVVGYFLAYLYTGRSQERLDNLSAELVGFSEDTSISNDWRLCACALLMGYCSSPEREALAWRIAQCANLVVAPLGANSPRVAQWLAEYAVFLSTLTQWQKRADTEVNQAFDRAMSYAERARFDWLYFRLKSLDLTVAMSSDDVDRADIGINALKDSLLSHRLIDHSMFWRANSDLAALKGQGAIAEHYARQSVALAESIEMLPTMQAVIYHSLAWALILQNRYQDAISAFKAAEAAGASSNSNIYTIGWKLLTALHAWRTEPQQARAAMTEALALVRAKGVYNFFRLSPGLTAQLCAMALAENIEPDLIKEVIDRRQLVPPDATDSSWPWSLRIYVMGGVRVELAGQLLDEQIRKQKKPFEVLRALISFGKLGADRAQLVRRVYPKQSYASARATFDVAFGRLKQILGDADFFTVTEGRISINARKVWVDVWYCDQLTNQIEAQLQKVGDAENAHLHRDVFGKICTLNTLFQGIAFAGDEDLPWIKFYTQSLAEKHIQATLRVGNWLEQTNRVEDAVTLYAQAVIQNPTVEALYQGLIRSQLTLQNYAEALRVFARCELAINSAYGVPISPKTAALVAGVLGER